MKSTLIALIGLGILSGCVSNVNPVVKQKTYLAPPTPVKEKKPYAVKQTHITPPPKKKIKLKKVEDTNYSDQYMYPEDTSAAKKDPVEKKTTPPVTASTTMTKEECIGMIGQEKFDNYTAMFGSETASIKRCTMLKAMQQ